jgi:hypothetical protein
MGERWRIESQALQNGENQILQRGYRSYGREGGMNEEAAKLLETEIEFIGGDNGGFDLDVHIGKLKEIFNMIKNK